MKRFALINTVLLTAVVPIASTSRAIENPHPLVEIFTASVPGAAPNTQNIAKRRDKSACHDINVSDINTLSMRAMEFAFKRNATIAKTGGVCSSEANYV